MNETTPEKLLRQERDDAVLAHHLALAYIKTLEKENRILRQELAAFGSHTADAALARKGEEDMKTFQDGDRLCVTRDDFINLQESPAYFLSMDSPMAATILRDGLLGLPLEDLSFLRAALAAKEKPDG